jgi:YggT family protein
MIAIVQMLDGLVGLFNVALFGYCLMSWFPNINRRDQPFVTLDRIFRPILAPIQRVVPPIGNIDLSAFVLMIALGMLSRGIHALVLQF